MEYQTVKLENNELKIMSTKTIDQSKLTSDCWLIQFSGLSACQNCEFASTPDCGGGNTLRQLNACKTK